MRNRYSDKGPQTVLLTSLLPSFLLNLTHLLDPFSALEPTLVVTLRLSYSWALLPSFLLP